MERLIIDRKKWRTGDDGFHSTGEGQTALLNSYGYMCCLGFECLRRGLNIKDIQGKGDPADVFNVCDDEESNKLGNMIQGSSNAGWVMDAININDNYTTTLAEKERLLESLFAEQGIEIEFQN